MKATFNQPFIPIGKHGLRQGELGGRRIRDVGPPTERFTMGHNRLFLAVDGTHLIAHRHDFALRPLWTGPSVANQFDVASFRRSKV